MALPHEFVRVGARHPGVCAVCDGDISEDSRPAAHLFIRRTTVGEGWALVHSSRGEPDEEGNEGSARGADVPSIRRRPGRLGGWRGATAAELVPVLKPTRNPTQNEKRATAEAATRRVVSLLGVWSQRSDLNR